jgi:hypothetical protein
MFRVFVDDNFHLHDESERDDHGRYPTYESAVAEASRLVDESLQSLYRRGMTAERLYDDYMDFGVDPFIRPAPSVKPFSAWGYALERTASIITEIESRAGSGGHLPSRDR